ncbi:hypothetical protein ARAM_004050 [Aspergillus rambellii]|uniref:Uncharacterized protein n=1 Tax=Aspergillus rambellii TaxID=308745 RepID=A0A0F8WQT8_9EURO|nr:hypothetical protein ARAM_004050 [Aspergillus rambellii]
MSGNSSTNVQSNTLATSLKVGAVSGLRSNLLAHYFEDNATSKQRTYASAVSGGIAGGGVTRLMGGRLIPGVVVFSLLGYVGQISYNAIDRWQLEQANAPSKPILQRIADSKWIPLKALSDDEYRGILHEKLLSIEAEMALIDEKIEELQQSKLTVSDPVSSALEKR